jgi:hypothetical protein
MSTSCGEIRNLLTAYSSLRSVPVDASRKLRSGALLTNTLPTGKVTILYDPTLPVGSGLLVDEGMMVCGTVSYEELTIDRCSVAEGLGLPVCRGRRLPDLSEERASKFQNSIILRLPGDEALPVSYVLNDAHDYTIDPGEHQPLPDSRTWFVSYDRGNNTGIDRVRLQDGIYEFRVKQDRWKLQKQELEFELDNTESDQDFTVVVNDKEVTIEAGQSKTLKSDRALVMKYDRAGGDSEPARKLLNKSGTLKLGVDPETNTWDWVSTSEDTGAQRSENNSRGLGV